MEWFYKHRLFSSCQILTFRVFSVYFWQNECLKKCKKMKRCDSRICPEVFIQKLSCISSSGDFQNKDQSDNLGIISSIYICQIRQKYAAGSNIPFIRKNRLEFNSRAYIMYFCPVSERSAAALRTLADSNEHFVSLVTEHVWIW